MIEEQEIDEESEHCDEEPIYKYRKVTIKRSDALLKNQKDFQKYKYNLKPTFIKKQRTPRLTGR